MQDATQSSLFSVQPRVVTTTHHASTTLFSQDAQPPPSWKSSSEARSMTASRRFPGGAERDATRSYIKSLYSRQRSPDQHHQARHQKFHYHASSQSPSNSSPDVGSQCGNVSILQRRCRVDLDWVCGHAPRLQTRHHATLHSRRLSRIFSSNQPPLYERFCLSFGDITPNSNLFSFGFRSSGRGF